MKTKIIHINIFHYTYTTRVYNNAILIQYEYASCAQMYAHAYFVYNFVYCVFVYHYCICIQYDTYTRFSTIHSHLLPFSYQTKCEFTIFIRCCKCISCNFPHKLHLFIYVLTNMVNAVFVRWIASGIDYVFLSWIRAS